MPLINANAESLKTAIEGDGTVIVDFWAEWCGPCKAFGPVFEKASKAHPDVTFAKVNTEEEQQLAGQFGIQSIPTIMVFREGVLLLRQAGALPPAALEDVLKQASELDMEKVHKEIAEHEEKHKNGECDHAH